MSPVCLSRQSQLASIPGWIDTQGEVRLCLPMYKGVSRSIVRMHADMNRLSGFRQAISESESFKRRKKVGRTSASSHVFISQFSHSF